MGKKQRKKILEEFESISQVIIQKSSEASSSFAIKEFGKYNKKFSKPLWHIIFFTSWYLVNILELDKKGNFFDVLSDR